MNEYYLWYMFQRFEQQPAQWNNSLWTSQKDSRWLPKPKVASLSSNIYGFNIHEFFCLTFPVFVIYKSFCHQFIDTEIIQAFAPMATRVRRRKGRAS
jgi:hypothetical protein